MQTVGEYLLAAVIFLATMAIAYGLALIFGGSWVEYVIGMALARVCLTGNNRPCTPELERTLRALVKLLKSRPPQLRGPFRVNLK
jgi:hypothetical protein